MIPTTLPCAYGHLRQALQSVGRHSSGMSSQCHPSPSTAMPVIGSMPTGIARIVCRVALLCADASPAGMPKRAVAVRRMALHTILGRVNEPQKNVMKDSHCCYTPGYSRNAYLFCPRSHHTSVPVGASGIFLPAWSCHTVWVPDSFTTKQDRELRLSPSFQLVAGCSSGQAELETAAGPRRPRLQLELEPAMEQEQQASTQRGPRTSRSTSKMRSATLTRCVFGPDFWRRNRTIDWVLRGHAQTGQAPVPAAAADLQLVSGHVRCFSDRFRRLGLIRRALRMKDFKSQKSVFRTRSSGHLS